MANIIIPIDKSYSIKTNPINKNLIQNITFYENNYKLNEGITLFIDDFNYWNISDKQATKVEDFEMPINVVTSKEYTNGIEGDGYIYIDYSSNPRQVYHCLRVSTINEYRIVSKIEDIGYKDNKIYAYDYNSNGFHNSVIKAEKQKPNFTICETKEEYDILINDISATDTTAYGYVYYEYNNVNNSFNIYLKCESEVIIYYVKKQDYNSSVNMYEKSKMQTWANYKLIVKANAYKFTEKQQYVLTSKNATSTNENSYTIDNEFINDKVIVYYSKNGKNYDKPIGDYNATQIREKYSNGKKVVSIEMPLLKLYNKNGEVVVNKKVLTIGQKIELKYLKNNNSSNYTNVEGITFVIIGIEFTYNGIAKMKIVGKEE